MKTPEGVFRRSRKIWRQPTLAQAIQALPSARLCLTAEFGMGSGRTTALWPPKIVSVSCSLSVARGSEPHNESKPNAKEQNNRPLVEGALPGNNRGPTTVNGQDRSLKTTHSKGKLVREFKSPFFSSQKKKTSDQAARPISTGRLKALRLLHVQPINPVVCRGSLGTCVRETISWEELGT